MHLRSVSTICALRSVRSRPGAGTASRTLAFSIITRISYAIYSRFQPKYIEKLQDKSFLRSDRPPGVIGEFETYELGGPVARLRDRISQGQRCGMSLRVPGRYHNVGRGQASARIASGISMLNEKRRPVRLARSP